MHVEARQVTHDNIIWRMRSACWTTRSSADLQEILGASKLLKPSNAVKWQLLQTRTHAILIAFHDKNGHANAPQYVVLRRLPVLSFSSVSWLTPLWPIVHLENPDSNLGKFMWILWLKNEYWERVFSEWYGFCLSVSLHSHDFLRPGVAVIRKRKIRNFPKKMRLRKNAKLGRHFFIRTFSSTILLHEVILTPFFYITPHFSYRCAFRAKS